ncbi:MAG: hypothetical protein D6731_13435 [Planctomycetota bacterium]|nr:MAG: hypothetical protein D6731_13435 [Planctomycetota bacterium]
MRCPHCNYENDAVAPVCNLCGAMLVVKLPKRSEQPERTAIDARIAAHRKTQRRKGLEEIQERLSKKLERLTALQTDSEVELLAHTRREEEALEEDLRRAEEDLRRNTEVLRETELRVRSLRRQVTALQFQLRRAIEERAAAAAERGELDAEFQRLRALRDALEAGAEIPPVASASSREVVEEVEGLQAVCLRLSERITVLERQLTERDSCLHWLLLESDPARFRERVRLVQAVDREVAAADGVGNDLLHWLRSSGGEARSDGNPAQRVAGDALERAPRGEEPPAR